MRVDGNSVYFAMQSVRGASMTHLNHALAKLIAAAAVALLAQRADAGGPFGIDHELALDQNGIWARKYQTTLETGVVAFEVAGSLWFGNDNELGHTLWQTVDSSVISGVGAQLLKYGFGRTRPSQGNDPNASKSLGVVSGNSAAVRRIRTREESGPLAVGCHRGLGIGYCGRLLEHDASHTDFRRDSTARLVRGIL